MYRFFFLLLSFNLVFFFPSPPLHSRSLARSLAFSLFICFGRSIYERNPEEKTLGNSFAFSYSFRDLWLFFLSKWALTMSTPDPEDFLLDSVKGFGPAVFILLFLLLSFSLNAFFFFDSAVRGVSMLRVEPSFDFQGASKSLLLRKVIKLFLDF